MITGGIDTVLWPAHDFGGPMILSPFFSSDADAATVTVPLSRSRLRCVSAASSPNRSAV